MTSFEIKRNLIRYFKGERKYPYLATECGSYNADFLASDGIYLYECEVKTSYQDFIADFKKEKHTFYKNAKDIIDSLPTYEMKQYFTHRNKMEYYQSAKSIPNKFYFAITENLEQKVLQYLEDDKKYGVLVVDNNILRCMKPAKKLHENKVEAPILLEMARRCAKDLCNETYSHQSTFK